MSFLQTGEQGNVMLHGFYSALRSLLQGDYPYLIRAKWIQIDYHRCIKVYETERIELEKDESGNFDLVHWKNKKSGVGQTVFHGTISQEDLLAEDYINPLQFNLCDTESDYKRIMEFFKD